jgi:phosphoglycolate phosphatase
MEQKQLRNIKLYIFDWDGTLADSIGVITSCLIDAFEETGLGNLDYDKAASIIGLPLVTALEILSPGITPENHTVLLNSYKKFFLQRSHADSLLFDGVYKTLEEIKNAGCYIAIATGKSRAGLERDFDNCNIRGFLSNSKTIDECSPKPDPHMINSIISELGLTHNETVMIGDTSFDLEMAKNAGVISLASVYGAHPREKLEAYKPLEMFNDFQSLSKFILEGLSGNN